MNDPMASAGPGPLRSQKPGNDKKSRPSGDNVQRKRIHFSVWYFVIAILALMMVQNYLLKRNLKEIPYSEFKSLVAEKKVESCIIDQDRIQGLLKPEALSGDDSRAQRPIGREFFTYRVADPDLTKDLSAAGVKYSGAVATQWFQNFLVSWVLPLIFLFALWGFLFKRMNPGMSVMAFKKSRARIYGEHETGVTFDDVAGIDEAKEELQEVVEFLKRPERYKGLGARIPKGVLLVGPPGTGKTLLAKAVAGEAGVPFFSMSGSDFVEMFVGLGAARVRDLFEQANRNAPCIIFIDELDALGKARGIGGPMAGHDEREQTLNQLLVQMDGFDPNAGVIIMGATNRPEILDPALLRPGRFDRHVLVDRPDLKGREAILRVHAKKIKLAPDVDLKIIAARTPGFVGADLANVVNESALLAARRGKTSVGMAEFEEAIERVVAGLEKKNRLLNENEKRVVAFHEAGHAIAASSVSGADPVHKVSIIPRGISALGYTLQLPTEDRYLMTRTELLDRMVALLGGRAAEEIVFDEISTGAQNDLEKATDIARRMVKEYGMSKRIGLVTYEQRQQPFLVGLHLPSEKSYSEETAREIDKEVEGLLEESYHRTKQILTAHRPLLDEIANLLLAKEVLEGEELKALLSKARPGNPSP
jgi:cell division protease FtsH